MKNFWVKYPILSLFIIGVVCLVVGFSLGIRWQTTDGLKLPISQTTTVVQVQHFVEHPKFDQKGVYICKHPGWENCRFFGPGNYSLRFCEFDPNLGDTNSIRIVPEGGYHITLYRGPEFYEPDKSLYQIPPEWNHSDGMKVKDNNAANIPDPPTTPCV